MSITDPKHLSKIRLWHRKDWIKMFSH